MRSILARSVFSAMAVVSVSMQYACGTGAGGDITGSAITGRESGVETRGPGPRPQDVAGTWSGSNQGLRLLWRLSQQGDDVTGTSEIGNSGWTGRDGSVTGRITGSTFTFSETHPAGNLAEADCSAELAGTLEVRTIEVPEHPSPNRQGARMVTTPTPATPHRRPPER